MKKCKSKGFQGWASIVECKMTQDGSKDVILFSAKLQFGSIWGIFRRISHPDFWKTVECYDREKEDVVR